jgi:ABC-type multidrug transport system ATPase subunit
MRILLTNAGKRFNREWIFRHLNCEFETGHSYAITGHNGSGKSTLLQVIAGAILLNEGNLVIENGKTINPDHHFKQISISAPFLELIEEMTATEFLDFHMSFKPLINGMSAETVVNKVDLGHAAGKQIRFYSSGMKQRLKLAQCILSDTPFVLLDEPCTNLDEKGIALYHSLIAEFTKDRCVIVSSNDKVEYDFCSQTLDISRFRS